MTKEKINILVTGGNGFVGGHLLMHLTQQHSKIKALIRSGSDKSLTEKIFAWYNAKPHLDKIEWTEGDVTDKDSLEYALKDITHLYHTAGLVSFDPKDKKNLFRVNSEGTENIVNTALESGTKKLCFVSSIAAIGRDGNNGTILEENPWDNNAAVSLYARSKHEAEREVWRGIAEGLNAIIVNPSIILGPGNWESGSVKMFQTVYNGLKYYTSGTNGYIDVNDLAMVMIQLMNSDISGERFIINSENISYQTLFTQMAEALKIRPPQKLAGKLISEIAWRALKAQSLLTGKKPLITKETARTANNDYFYSNEKIRKAINFEFRPIKETIDYTAKFFLSDTNKSN
ncbi:MAG: NAD-dependent epimerase/dehydratase family protein [Bacteroidales bacterium]|nr:NAD-dependent epimerase/dehydratase family protein [Bacteroidales bacterium]